MMSRMRLFQDDEETRMSWDSDDLGFADLDGTVSLMQGSSSAMNTLEQFYDEDSGLGMESEMEDTDRLIDEIQGESASNEQEHFLLTLNKHLDDSDLIGDGSMRHGLPTVRGKHQDLKSITDETLSMVIRGEYSDITRFTILDCRYPYEYDGGHIVGAQNTCTNDDVMGLLNRHLDCTNGRRPILIFHCEFSSERAPRLCRLLREKDRELNRDKYPYLSYPEIYLLDGGYSNFYKSYKNFCEPQNYTPMLQKEYATDLRHFRRKSKSWASSERRTVSTQRLQF